MKKKPTPEPVIAKEIMEMAKRSVDSDKPVKTKRCAVCDAACTPSSLPHQPDEEDLCWVCRRLKISAWRDTDQQMSAQE